MYTLEEIKAAGLDDFRVFLRQVWDYLGLPPPTPVQNDIAWALQHGPRRLIIQGFRGVGKSWITVAFVLWVLFLDPQKKIMVVSAGQKLADDFSKFCKQLIHGMPLLQHLAPREGQRDSAVSFDVGPATPSKDPSVKSVGITGQLSGSRADLIVPDDVEIPKNSYTQLLRTKLSEAVKEFDAVLKPGGRVVGLGTPQNEDTVYKKMRSRGYTTMVWPSEIPEKIEQYGGTLGRYIVKLMEKGAKAHDPVDPRRFDAQDLAERKASYGRSGYALQFMLDTSLSDADKHPLRTRDLIVLDVDADRAPVSLVWGRDREHVIQDLQSGGLDGDFYVSPVWQASEMAPWQGTVMAIDPSGRGTDETAIAVVRYLYGWLYCVKIQGWKDGFAATTLDQIAAIAGHYKVGKVIIEKNYGGGMFDQLLRPYLARVSTAQIAMDEEWKPWSSGQKEARICDTLEPIMNNHKLVMARSVIEADVDQQEEKEAHSFIYQLTRMERIKGALAHEDRLEALSMACSFFVEKMNRDAQKVVAQHQEKLLDEELRKFMKSALGNKNLGWRNKGYLRVIR